MKINVYIFPTPHKTMIIDIIQTITQYSRLDKQICLCQLNKSIYDDVLIYDASTDSTLNCMLTDSVLKQKRFSKLKSLNLNNNYKITDLSYLDDTLVWLDCGYSLISQNNILKLTRLETLHVTGNSLIGNINHLAPTLKKLYCGATNTELHNNGVCKLSNLQVLDISNNIRIYDLDCFSDSLEELHCSGYSNITQHSIFLLKNLKKLYCRNNILINDIDHIADKLIELDCSGHSSINQSAISKLSKLEVLIMDGNKKIYDIHHLCDTLIQLYCKDTNVLDKCINNLSKIKMLDIRGCQCQKIKRNLLNRLECFNGVSII